MSKEEKRKTPGLLFQESIFSFLKMRKVPIIIFTGIVFLFAVLFYLYDIPQDAVIYGTQLSLVWGIVWLLIDFRKYYKRHRLLYINREQFVNSAEELPEYMDSIEYDYQELVKELCQQKKDLISQNRISRKEMLDYYGMWVHQIKTPIAAMDILLQNTEQVLYQLGEKEFVEKVFGDSIERKPDGTEKSSDNIERKPGSTEKSLDSRERKPGSIEKSSDSIQKSPDDIEQTHNSIEVSKEETADISPDKLLEFIQEAMPISDMKMELFKIEQYVEMALNYLRVEDISSDLAFKRCAVDSMVRQVIRKYSKIFISKKMKMNFKPTERYVITDEKWFVFVLEQLISNALKYTKQGKIAIYMQEDSLVIEDTGIGIPAEDIPRIFEKGFTGYNGRENKKSTGIGLYLCKNIMDKLQWNITVTSKVGAGTKIYLTKM